MEQARSLSPKKAYPYRTTLIISPSQFQKDQFTSYPWEYLRAKLPLELLLKKTVQVSTLDLLQLEVFLLRLTSYSLNVINIFIKYLFPCYIKNFKPNIN